MKGIVREEGMEREREEGILEREERCVKKVCKEIEIVLERRIRVLIQKRGNLVQTIMVDTRRRNRSDWITTTGQGEKKMKEGEPEKMIEGGRGREKGGLD